MSRLFSAVLRSRSSNLRQGLIFGIISSSFYLLSYLAINSNPGQYLNSLVEKEIERSDPAHAAKRSFGSNGGAPKTINGFNGR